MPVQGKDTNKQKRCKDCNPNKYIEGLAFRGANGHNFDAETSIVLDYNDLGEPSTTKYSTGIVNPKDIDPQALTKYQINVSDLVDAYNPVLSNQIVSAIRTITPGEYPGFINGVDRSAGFWFIWDLKDGLCLRGDAAQINSPIKFFGTFTHYQPLQKGQDFIPITFQSEQEINYFSFDQLATQTDLQLYFDQLDNGEPSNSRYNTDILRSNNKVSKIGYFTSKISTNIVTSKKDKKKKPIILSYSKSLTLKVKDTFGNDPIRITSSPLVRALNGTDYSSTPLYTFTSNITLPSANDFDVSPTTETITTLNILGLRYESSDKTIRSNGVFTGIQQAPRTDRIKFIVSNQDKSSGQTIDFYLTILSGANLPAAALPTLSNTVVFGTVNKALNKAALAGTSTSNLVYTANYLPEGIVLNSTTGALTGTPKHFYSSINSSYNGALIITVGSKNITIGTDLKIMVGQYVEITNNTNALRGFVTSYNSITGALQVNITSVVGKGTINTLWTVKFSGISVKIASGNGRSTIEEKTLTFIFNPYSDPDPKPVISYPNSINIFTATDEQTGDSQTQKANISIDVTMEPEGDALVYFASLEQIYLRWPGPKSNQTAWYNSLLDQFAKQSTKYNYIESSVDSQYTGILKPISATNTDPNFRKKTLNFTYDSILSRKFYIRIDDATSKVGTLVIRTEKYLDKNSGQTKTRNVIDPTTGQPVYDLRIVNTKKSKNISQEDYSINVKVNTNVSVGDPSFTDTRGRRCYPITENTKGPVSKAKERELALRIRNINRVNRSSNYTTRGVGTEKIYGSIDLKGGIFFADGKLSYRLNQVGRLTNAGLIPKTGFVPGSFYEIPYPYYNLFSETFYGVESGAKINSPEDFLVEHLLFTTLSEKETDKVPGAKWKKENQPLYQMYIDIAPNALFSSAGNTTAQTRLEMDFVGDGKPYLIDDVFAEVGKEEKEKEGTGGKKETFRKFFQKVKSYNYNYRGQWVSSRNYEINDHVYITISGENRHYACTAKHTSTSNLNNDINNWKPIYLKYPNGIPTAAGVYACKIIPMDPCSQFGANGKNLLFTNGQRDPNKYTFLFRLYENDAAKTLGGIALEAANAERVYTCTFTVNRGAVTRGISQRAGEDTRAFKPNQLNSYFTDVNSAKQYFATQNQIQINQITQAKCGPVALSPINIPDNRYIQDYIRQAYNEESNSEDIGITSLTNISILDILSEGPIEGIVDYEIKPLEGSIGDIGFRKIKIEKYPGQNSFIRSVYWNETPIADDKYGIDGSKGSMNFSYVKMLYSNADHTPEHISLKRHEDIYIKEEIFSKNILPGRDVTNDVKIKLNGAIEPIKDIDTQAPLRIKVPRLLTHTKTSGMKLFGSRQLDTGEVFFYKKSINILSKNLSGLRLHIKVASLFRQEVDLTIFETTKEAQNNTTSGRIDRYAQLYYLRLKRIDDNPIQGQTSTYINKEGIVTNLVNSDQSYDISPNTGDTWVLKIVGKFNQGGYIETFEWLGLDKISQQNTIGWEIEITPIHRENVEINIANKSNIDSITEIYSDRLINPNTASVLTTFDSRFFNSIPQRAYDVRLLKVKIPSNYNPYSKTYDGNWDGRFILGWTDNPAWCFYDMLTNNRFGLGKYFDSRYIDKWTLYEIGKYCDQLVSSGKRTTDPDGNEYLFELEPRFTCNLLLSTREDAYKVLNDMASVFRGIVYYTAGLIFASQDKPKDPIYLFNNSNVKEGEFTYSNTSKRVRRNVILVRYNDKNNFYKPAVKYVENREGIIRYGIREMEISAFGCTSEGQAKRLGKWTLLSENSESELVAFETSLPALYLKPGDIILIQDQNRQNNILGGRTYDLTPNYAILDVKYEKISGFLPVISGCTFNVLTPAGNIEIGTASGNSFIDLGDSNPEQYKLFEPVLYTPTGNQKSEGISSSILRRSQIQSISYTTFSGAVEQVTGLNDNFYGYTKIRFPNELDNRQHTLLKNTVWTIELDPSSYDANKSPSTKSLVEGGRQYPGGYLEPYIDQTQKFRVLDIEELEEQKYKISALQYDDLKFSLADDI